MSGRGVSARLPHLHAAAPIAAVLLSALPASVLAQTTAPNAPAAASQNDPIRLSMPAVTVTAQKTPEDKQKVPVSVTAVTESTIDDADIHWVSEAGIFAPNTFFTEASARKLSNARFRGVGSSPANPAITTYFDGVPQLNANSSSIELLDVHQVEFVRGPQSALFGRNALGGLVNVTSARPSLSAWTGSFSVPFGNYGSWAIRGGASGPVIKDKVSVGVSISQVDRDGFTENDVTGNDVDSRSAFSAKAQMLWTPNKTWESRVIFSAERARDGDYALSDVGGLRANPFHTSRDFEGFSNRDIVGTTVLVRRAGGPVSFASTTGFVNWKTQDVTDLDYSPLPVARRNNAEEDFQFTQEFRFASSDGTALKLSDATQLRWQGGLFLFSQNYDQNAVNSYAPFVVAPIALDQTSPLAALDDFGVGVYGQGTLTFNERLDVTAGARVDYENKSANLQSFYSPAIAPATVLDTEDSFSNVSPQVSAAYSVQPGKMVYGTVSRGFKAGGFNPASPVGSASYGEEHTWNVEGGLKTTWANNRLSANGSFFYIDWQDLQLNVPDPFVPGQFYISNVGDASSKGAEFELAARAAEGVDVFTSVGYTRARFGAGSTSSGLDVGGNKIPNAPDYTFSFGGQYARALGSVNVLARADAVFYGAFEYDDQNTLGQDAYSVVNLRVAATSRLLMAELVIRNAFDTHYIPFAFPYPGLAPSGFVGEMGAPRTITFGAGVRF
jgi:iron complex outermembrane receptor protein